MKSWSVTQGVTSLSSGEAEYYGMVRGASMGMGLRGLMNDLGIQSTIKVKTDASAANGIAHKTGLGKVRHLETNQLWLQEKVLMGEIKTEKVHGEKNLADALTKYLIGDKIQWHIENTGGHIESGRHKDMPSVGS